MTAAPQARKLMTESADSAIVATRADTDLHNTGGTFPFLSLPPEVRNEIYYYMLDARGVKEEVPYVKPVSNHFQQWGDCQ